MRRVQRSRHQDGFPAVRQAGIRDRLFLRLSLLTAFLLLAVTVVPVVAAGHRSASADPPVNPSVVEQVLSPGGSMTVDKTVRTPVVPPRPDVVLLVDTTLSMKDSIHNVQKDLDRITSSVTNAQHDSRFAVVAFADLHDGKDIFSVRQGLTDNLKQVSDAVNGLKADFGGDSGGPAEDWINALWQIAPGGGHQLDFRSGASPIVVLVGDASSHDPSNGHTLTDTISVLTSAKIRVIGVDLKTDLGDGLDGNGTIEGNPGPIHAPDEGTTVTDRTTGKLLANTDPSQVVPAIVSGLTSLPTTVTHQAVGCDPALTVTLDPPSFPLHSGETAAFTETIHLADDAAQGTEANCAVQFLLDGQIPDGSPPTVGGDPPGDGASLPPNDYEETIGITVRDVTAPVVTVDDRSVPADATGGKTIDYTATAQDNLDGTLPVTCDPPSGSRFPLGTTRVSCSATDAAGNTGTDTAVFTVLQPPVPNEADLAVHASVTPLPGWTGHRTNARLTVTNTGPRTATHVVVAVSWPQPGSSGRPRSLSAPSACTTSRPCTLPAGGRITVTQYAVYHSAVDGTLRATLNGSPRDPNTGDNTATARVRILRPRLTVTPAVAMPGDVVIARGTDFPPGVRVPLSWAPGITAASTPVVVGADGTFEAQMLVLRKDTLGPRDLRARVTGYDPLRKPVLVVQRSMQPPDFAGRG